MRKKLSICLFLICIIIIPVRAKNHSCKYVYDLRGKETNEVSLSISDLIWKDDNEYTLITEEEEKRVNIDSLVLENARENENVIIMDFRTDNEENPYPEIESMDVAIDQLIPSGGWRHLGKDYRLMYFFEDIVEDLSGNITTSNKNKVNFTVDKLGKYVIYLNPKVYDIVFYMDEPIPIDEEYIMPEIYYENEEISKEEFLEFPEIPKRDGYVFTGWKAPISSGELCYTEPQPIYGNSDKYYYASWCQEDEYEPINIEISADKITKGKEDGKKITITTNYEVFADEEELNSEPEYWKVIGSDEITIELVKRINDKKLELTLSGNSSDKYDDTDIYIEFHCGLISSDEKIKMDEDGVTAEFYRSDNAITLKKQNKPNSGGGGGGTRIPATVYAPVMQSSVIQDNRIILTIGKMEASVFGEVVTNDVAPVIKDDRTFLPARFVAESLGAEVKWDEELKTVTITKDKTEIAITIDSETAIVNGETVTLDSPAFIENDRTYTPVRFVAEMLGAKVEWTEELQTVTITK